MTTKTPKTKKPAAPVATLQPGHFDALRARLGLSLHGLALYLGAPVHTVRKWSTGERMPPAAVLRLLDVLTIVETLAPGLHAALLPTAADAPRRGRPPKGQVLESTENAP
jgi:DNA-binding transcriptional regulator YiaG